MIYRLKITKTAPATVQWIINLWLIYLFIFTGFRIITMLLFRPADVAFSAVVPSFFLGFQYDAKWIAVILLPIAVFSIHHRCSPFYSEMNKKLWSYYLALSTFIVLVFFGADFGNFSYNHTRINASVLNFSEDFAISYRMLWQTYPMVWILGGLVFAAAMLVQIFRKIHLNTEKNSNASVVSYKEIWHAGVLFFLAWCLYGIFSFSTLKWSRAFKFNDNFKSYLALNPLQNFFSTLKFRNPSFDDAEAKKYFPLIADFLQIDNADKSSQRYQRTIQPGSKSLESKPNVVLVICESFSMYKSSMSGNPLNTTPYFNSLTKEGIFFNHCFSATFGTARGVFAIVTGIPDVQLSKFSTRNPEAINQHTIINNFEDYSRMYFLGGSSNFNNYEGLIKNIDGVKIFQDGSYKSPQLNVWGISDKNLFLEANEELKKQTKPFFAIIQTADNHRPFNIPAEDSDFVKRNIPKDTLEKYGFESLPEFQAFCYTDYCFKKFIEAAKHQTYFNNTIFIFIGDHGLEGNAKEMYPDAWTSARLSDEHVPLLFYAPGLLEPELRTEVVSQVDVLPTLAGMVHQTYTNTTLGRDLLQPGEKQDAAFIIHHDEGNIGVITDDFYYIKNLNINRETLLPVKSNRINLSLSRQDSVKHTLSTLTSAMYETAKWMLVNNKKKEKTR